LANNASRAPPDLLVEVLSKSTRSRDRGLKAKRYAKAGVQVYWIVDPVNDTLEIFRNEGGTYAKIATVRSPESYESPDFGVTVPLRMLFAK
jgi:Uma2 family endonuclease